ncbi:MAG: hypothetical protein IJR68_11660 [Fretibacterium sp.]|nr:hypothetical protein [Fretibacterium sp.]
MGIVLKAVLYIGLFLLGVFGVMFCLALIIQIMDSLGIKKPIISAMRRAWETLIYILRHAGTAVIYAIALWSFIVDALGIIALVVIALALIYCFISVLIEHPDAFWEILFFFL